MPPKHKSIGAVVVFYKPQQEQANKLLKNLAKQVQHIVIVDNSPQSHHQLVQHLNLTYIHQPNNVGIAAAHNLGIEQLIAMHCHLGLLLDQDSELPSAMVQQLTEHIASPLAQQHKVAAMGPAIKCSFSQQVEVAKQGVVTSDDGNLVFVPQIIASGMMINLAYWAHIGPKLQTLFIDGVDFEWCWRAKSLGYQIAYLPAVVMLHTQGEYRRNLGCLSYRVGSPLRLYYQFRNTLLLCRVSHVPRYWKLKSIILLPLRFIVQLICEPSKKQRAHYMCKGLVHGMIGRSGSVDSAQVKITENAN